MCLQQASAMHLGFGADTAGSGQTLLYVGCVMHSINIYTSITYTQVSHALTWAYQYNLRKSVDKRDA